MQYNILKSEKYIYFTIWISAVLFSLYCFTANSYTYFKNYDDKYDDFTEGFYYFLNKRDKSDFEWETIYFLLQHFFPWIFLYITVSECIRNLPLSVDVFRLWQIIFPVFYILAQLGYFVLLLVLLQPALFYTFCNIYRSTIIPWLCGAISLPLITVCKQLSLNNEVVDALNLNLYQLYITTLCLFWMNLRCISYFLEPQCSRNLFEFLSYCLYPPTVFTGPFILPKDYLNIYKPVELSHQRVQKLFLNFGRCVFWFLCINFCLHYVYVNATGYQAKLVESFDTWSLYGYGYAMGQFFHIKYVVLYGLSTSFASFDNINTPSLPRCIGRVHLYSDMWKYFDPGLYSFLLRYIYLPLYEICRYKLIASFACFLFVYLWHGVENYILIWTFLNYIGIVLEYITGLLYKTYYSGKIDNFWLRRMKCIAASPLLAVSAVSNFYFFAGTEIGNIFVSRIFKDNLIVNTVLLLILYCCCQVSTELRDINATKM